MTAIKFTARKVSDASAANTQCAVLPLFSESKLTGAASALNKATGGAIKSTLELGDFSAKAGQSCLLPGAGKCKRLLLVGCGEKKKFDRAAARGLAQSIYRGLNETLRGKGVYDKVMDNVARLQRLDRPPFIGMQLMILTLILLVPEITTLFL